MLDALFQEGLKCLMAANPRDRTIGSPPFSMWERRLASHSRAGKLLYHYRLHVLNSGGSIIVILLRFKYSGKPYKRSPM
jgi:hypothetical protein